MEAELRVSANSNTHTTIEHKGNKPVHKVKAGPIIATIWANEGTKVEGESTMYYTISLDRVYKDKDEWKHTNSLRTNDLPKAQLVLQKAYEFLALSEQ